MTSKTHENNDEENSLKEALLSRVDNDIDNVEPELQKPGQLKEESIDDHAHWSPCKKGIFLVFLILASCFSCFNVWLLVRPRVSELKLVLKDLPKDVVLTAPLQQDLFASKEQEEDFLAKDAKLPMDFEIVPMEKVLNMTSSTSSSSTDNNLRGPIPPPFHPHHTAYVTYSSRMGPDGTVEYRRDINAPCEFGMLIFSVGPAKDSLPYTYELYNDAYLYSDNNGLCMLYPSYNGYQTSQVPLWNPTDPLQVVLKPLDKGRMHWISSRVYDPYRSAKSWDRTKVGDYAIIAKYNFYDPGFYKALKNEINSWK